MEPLPQADNNNDDERQASLEAWRQGLTRRKELVHGDSLYKEFFPELPDYLLEITSTEVQLVFGESALPYSNIKFEALDDVISEEYELDFVPPGIAEAEVFGGSKPAREQIGQYLLRSADPELRFAHGLYRVGGGKAFVILELRLMSEGVFAKCVGPTSVGEQFAAEIMSMLWALVGVRRPWEELVRQLAFIKYGTGTRVHLPGAALPVLSTAFVATLEALSTPGGLLRGMGPRPPHNQPPDPSSAGYSAFTLDELWVLFHRVSATGVSNVSQLKISVTRRSEQGSGTVTISSELPFGEHFDLVAMIIAACEKEEAMRHAGGQKPTT